MTQRTEPEQTRSWARRMQRDPIAKILADNSHLTKVQLETLIIDYLLDGFSGKHSDYETKAGLRDSAPKEKRTRGVSRGAFNRSLAQARTNVTKSIFTLVLLGYLGLFETPSLMRYQDLAEQIRSYAREYDIVAMAKATPTPTHLRTLKQTQDRIVQLIEALAKPIALKSD
ncbi:MAG: hypothetical protein ACFE89_08280 [Candidatus Hodarchaeota archaeon]